MGIEMEIPSKAIGLLRSLYLSLSLEFFPIGQLILCV